MTPPKDTKYIYTGDIKNILTNVYSFLYTIFIIFMLQINPAAQNELNIIRSLFKEYAEWMDYQLCFDSFEKELDQLPGQYAPPTGELLLAVVDNQSAGCIALKKVDRSTCEMKRLWVKKEFRNQKIGIALIREIISVAETLNYKKMRLETTPIMAKAVELYKSIGFEIEPSENNTIVMFKNL